MERLICMNARRSPNKGLAMQQPLERYDLLTRETWLRDMVKAIREGDEKQKDELPLRCPHYRSFKDDKRRQDAIIPEAFTFQTCVDIDDLSQVERAIRKARELNAAEGIWKGMLLHMDYSARRKLHIDIRMPIGMTIEETQQAYCEAIDMAYDESCTTPERFIYITDSESEIYRSEDWYAVLTDEELAEDFSLLVLEDDDYLWIYNNAMPPVYSETNYKETLKKLGYVDLDSPSVINIYASSFEDKDAISEEIKNYNNNVEKEDEITYTDIVALLMSSITSIINVISYVLIAFVAISLVVSSIMIGIITYISVLERTKEIGILRAIGASKRDVSRVFNAETFIIGFAAGAIGIGITALLNIPINVIVHDLTGIQTLNSALPWVGAISLVLMSITLTFIAGLIPSGLAAKKDPVEALRTE